MIFFNFPNIIYIWYNIHMNVHKKEILIFKNLENMDKKEIICYPYFRGTLFLGIKF